GIGLAANYGVMLRDAGTSLSSAHGNILVTGQGGSGTAAYSHGVVLHSGAVVHSTGSGVNAASITLDGIGGMGNRLSSGVWLFGANTAVNSIDGDILISGIAGDNGNGNYGVYLESGATVASAGTGANAATVTVEGIGGA